MRDAAPPGLLESDFDAIHAAVMETARGRWFLAEYARRNRMADTRMVLDAVARLENVIAAGPSAQHVQPQPAQEALSAAATQIAERLSNISWDLRERGFADDVCAAVDRQATAVQGLARRLENLQERPQERPLENPAAAEFSHFDRPAANEQRLLEPPPSLRASMHAALSHLDALPLARRLEIFV